MCSATIMSNQSLWERAWVSPHTNGVALQDACVCRFACLPTATCGHILKMLIERMDMKVHVHFKFAHLLNSSVAFSRSIGVELDSEKSIVSTCNITKLNFEDVTSLTIDIIFLYQLAQAHPHNVLQYQSQTTFYSEWLIARVLGIYGTKPTRVRGRFTLP